MHKHRDELWTWLLPDTPGQVDEGAWLRHGGKWIVFDRKDRLLRLARKLAPHIDAGEIHSAKYWNRDPGAICVYSLDSDRNRVRELLEELGAGDAKVWEYDYAWDRNIKNPFSFLYSQASKFRTILKSYGISGTLQLLGEVLKPPGGKRK
jgi:hypothetical protein